MTRKTCFFLISLLLLFLFSLPATARDYQHSLETKKMSFAWTVEGKNLAIKINAKTKGWVGIGFNPQKKMKGANFIIGYVKKGKVKISDDFGTRTTGHSVDIKKGGKNNILSSSGSEKGGVTTLEFTIPLNSGDKTDTPLVPSGKTIVLLAYGARDSFRIGHKFHTIFEVNLMSGQFKEAHVH